MLLAANLGMSAREMKNEKRPLGSNMTRPFGFGPNRLVLVPSLLVSIEDTKIQCPTIWSLSVFCCAIALPETNARERMVANVTMLRMIFLLDIVERAARDCARVLMPS